MLQFLPCTGTAPLGGQAAGQAWPRRHVGNPKLLQALKGTIAPPQWWQTARQLSHPSMEGCCEGGAYGEVYKSGEGSVTPPGSWQGSYEGEFVQVKGGE